MGRRSHDVTRPLDLGRSCCGASRPDALCAVGCLQIAANELFLDTCAIGRDVHIVTKRWSPTSHIRMDAKRDRSADGLPCSFFHSDKKLETEGKTDKAAGEDRSGWAIISSAWLRLAENSSCDASGFIRASGR